MSFFEKEYEKKTPVKALAALSLTTTAVPALAQDDFISGATAYSTFGNNSVVAGQNFRQDWGAQSGITVHTSVGDFDLWNDQNFEGGFRRVETDLTYFTPSLEIADGNVVLSGYVAYWHPAGYDDLTAFKANASFPHLPLTPRLSMQKVFGHGDCDEGYLVEIGVNYPFEALGRELDLSGTLYYSDKHFAEGRGFRAFDLTLTAPLINRNGFSFDVYTGITLGIDTEERGFGDEGKFGFVVNYSK